MAQPIQHCFWVYGSVVTAPFLAKDPGEGIRQWGRSWFVLTGFLIPL